MKYLLAIVLFTFTFSCTRQRVPADILPRDKMEKVLWEMLEAEEWALHEFPVDTIARKQAALRRYAQVYHINGIDAAVFKRSYDYYAARPELLYTVFDSARNRAEAPPSAAPVEARPRKVLRPQ